jgi:hypothetical protein
MIISLLYLSLFEMMNGLSVGYVNINLIFLALEYILINTKPFACRIAFFMRPFFIFVIFFFLELNSFIADRCNKAVKVSSLHFYFLVQNVSWITTLPGNCLLIMYFGKYLRLKRLHF